jgi:hypothetical protein
MSQRYNFSLRGLIFFGVPPPLQPVEGGGSVKGGKEKFVTRLAFGRARDFWKKRRSCDEPESLPSRISRTLDGVPRNGQWGWEHKKSPIELVLLCFKLFTTITNAKKPLILIGFLRSGFWNQLVFGASPY